MHVFLLAALLAQPAPAPVEHSLTRTTQVDSLVVKAAGFSVENAEDKARALLLISCEMLQGYLFGQDTILETTGNTVTLEQLCTN